MSRHAGYDPYESSEPGWKEWGRKLFGLPRPRIESDQPSAQPERGESESNVPTVTIEEAQREQQRIKQRVSLINEQLIVFARRDPRLNTDMTSLGVEKAIGKTNKANKSDQ